MDYRKAAENRKSIREFTDRQLSEDCMTAIKNSFDQCRRLKPEIETEQLLVNGSDYHYLEDCVGYEGMSFHAPVYLVLLSELAPGYLENAGYMIEDLILTMTDMGIDSCWLTVIEGETLKDILELDTGKTVAAVVAVGYGKKERSLTRLHIKSPSNVEIVTREGHVAPKMAVSEMVYGDSWNNPADLDENLVDGGLLDAFYAASCAPTFLNRQPFRFLMGDAKVLLIKKLDSMTGECDGRLNCGAIMLNFAAVLEERRPFSPKWVLGKPEKEYPIPADCEIVGYCEI